MDKTKDQPTTRKSFAGETLGRNRSAAGCARKSLSGREYVSLTSQVRKIGPRASTANLAPVKGMQGRTWILWSPKEIAPIHPV